MQHDFILLDRSGSMSEGGRWSESLNGVNAYVKKLAEDGVDTAVTLAVFDTGKGGILDYNVLRNGVEPTLWKDVTNEEASPRGWTPLNDAIGKMVGIANAGTYDKVAIIIMTDGAENSSREITTKGAKDMLDACRKKGWQVIFLGADYENMAQAESYGTMRGQYVNSSVANLAGTMAATASMRSAYGATGQSMYYSDDLLANTTLAAAVLSGSGSDTPSPSSGASGASGASGSYDAGSSHDSGSASDSGSSDSGGGDGGGGGGGD